MIICSLFIFIFVMTIKELQIRLYSFYTFIIEKKSGLNFNDVAIGIFKEFKSRYSAQPIIKTYLSKAFGMSLFSYYKIVK